MKLLSVEEIAIGLDLIFAPIEEELPGMRLIPKQTPLVTLDACAATLGVRFPTDFRQLVSKYDFGNLTIGPIVFGSSGDYCKELLELNARKSWPVSCFAVANSDPYAIILDGQCGSVRIVDPSDSVQPPVKISDSFELFVRGVGTTMLARGNVIPDALSTFITGVVNCESPAFWRLLAA